MRTAKDCRNLSLVVFSVVVTVMILALCVPDSMAAIDPCKVIVYEHANYGGTSRTLTSSNANVGEDWNDKISSFKVFGNARIRIHEHSNYGGHWNDYTGDVPKLSDKQMQPPKFLQSEKSWNDQITSLEIFCPQSSVDKTTLAFGDLYHNSRDGAQDFNHDEGKERTLKLSNDSGRTLQWAITGKSSHVTVSPTATTASPGSIDASSSTTFTVKLSPTTVGNGSFTIDTNSSDHAITLTATVHDTPTLSYIAPALGSNGKVNVAVNEEVIFEVGEVHPDFPGSTTAGYQWQTQLVANQPDSTQWSTSNVDRTWRKTFTTAGDLKVYARMVDNKGVATEPAVILVKVWEKPVVAAIPPTPVPSSWLSGKYVGVVNQPITLKAAPTLATFEPTLNAAGLTTGRIGSGAGVFDGTANTDIDAGDKIYLANQSMTIAMWIKRDRSSFSEWVITQGTASNNNGLHFGFRSNNQFAFAFWANDLNVDATKIPSTDTTNWHHWIGTYDASSGERKLYVDGAFVDGDTASANYQGSGNLWIGGRFGSAGFFDGNVDDVAIFGRALSITDIADLGTQGLTGREDGLVYFNTFDFDGKDSHKVSRYLWYDDSNLTNLLATQLPGQTTSVTFDQQNANGKIYCVAVTNHGIRSDKKSFDLKVYPTLMAEAGNPYTGRPLTAVTLSGSVNSSGYSSATFSYEWKADKSTPPDGDFDDTGETLTASSDPKAEFTWTVDGTYGVELTVTTTTQEGLQVTATDTSTVTVQAGVPMALPGGPYRGGIAGGNFSPVQLEDNSANHPLNDSNVGNITAWDWGVRLDMQGTPKGLATEDQGFIQLNPLSGGGQFEYTDLPLGDVFVVKGEFWTGGGTGADAFYIYLWANSTPGHEDHAVGQYSINYDEYQNRAAGGEIQLNHNGQRLATQSNLQADLETNTDLTGSIDLDDSQWHSFKVDFDSGNFKIYLDDVLKLTYDDSANYQSRMAGNLFGFGSRTGGANNEHRVRDMEWIPRHINLPVDNVSDPTVEILRAGTYAVSLRVTSDAQKESPLATTSVTVVDGKIEGRVRAADLRTPVKEVAIKLTSSHVDINALARVATNNAKISTTGDGGLSTLTDEEGKYSFSKLPLGSYTLVASKGVGDGIHEFETREYVTELTLDAPNQLAIDYTDLSVFPVGGQIYYSILKNTKKVLVENVRVTAQPVGNASPIRSLASTKALTNNQNYSLPLFAGEYLFDATRSGHDIRLAGTTPTTGTTVGTAHANYNGTSGLVTISGALTDLDFVDYTTRTITVVVEDSGGNPIEKNSDGNTIQVDVTGTNGAQTGPVVNTGQTVFTAIVPPGHYTVGLPNVPSATVKGDSSKKVAEVDVTGDNGTVTMVVPVKIVLAIGPAPKLFGVGADFLADIGLTEADNPDNFMYYYGPQPQTHAYDITATANGNRVADFTIEIVDNISQTTSSIAPTMTYTAQSGNYNTTGSGSTFVGQYTIAAGIPNATVVDESQPSTYVIDADSGNKVPRVQPKTITFRASKDNYEASDVTTLSVTVLGDLADGNFSQLVSVPNVNYIVLHDPPGR